jgi:hypothetical protein
MSAVRGAFESAEVLGDHDHRIAEGYARLELAAVGAVKAHDRNEPGGAGASRVHQSRGLRRNPAIVEITRDDGNPPLARSLYEVFETPPGP